MTETNDQRTTDPRLLQLAPEDNIAAAKTTLSPGETLLIGGVGVPVATRIPTGHKVALAAIPAGAKVIKYGAPIGSATRDIQPGDYVHTHNVTSDYLPTFTLDGSNPYLRDEETCKGI